MLQTSSGCPPKAGARTPTTNRGCQNMIWAPGQLAQAGCGHRRGTQMRAGTRLDILPVICPRWRPGRVWSMLEPGQGATGCLPRHPGHLDMNISTCPFVVLCHLFTTFYAILYGFIYCRRVSAATPQGCNAPQGGHRQVEPGHPKTWGAWPGGLCGVQVSRGWLTRPPGGCGRNQV